MFKIVVIIPFLFSFWFCYVKIFSRNKNSSVNNLSKKVLTDITSIFRNIFDLFDSFFKSFIQIYELLGSLLKNIEGILKSLILTLVKFINLFKIICNTFLSAISLCQALYEETKNINPFNNIEFLLNQTKSAKNNVVKIFKLKGEELNNKEGTLNV